jgi:hypothetical protein
MKKEPKPLDETKLLSAPDREARENQLIAMAYDLVEQRIRDGTATSQETTHFLRLGSTRARYETKKLEKEIELMDAKREAMESAKRIEALYSNAIKAFRSYGGGLVGGDDEQALQ